MTEAIPIEAYRTQQAGSGAGGADLHTAKFIVGNELAGDTAEMCHFLDPGDGTGLALAVAAAVTANAPADIWLRSGTYDLSLPASPTLPIVLPESAFPGLTPALNIRCATPTAPLLSAGILADTPGARIIVGDNRHIFTGPAASNSIVFFDGLLFDMNDIAVAAVGDYLIGGTGGAYGFVGATLRNCQVRLPPSGADVNETLSALFQLAYAEIDSCAILGAYANGAAGGTALTAVNSSQVTLRASTINGMDRCAVAGGLLYVTGNTIACVAGIEAAGGATQLLASGNAIQVTTGIGIRVGSGNSGAVINGNIIRGSGSSSVGVSAEGSNAAITGNTMVNHDIGVDVTATAVRTLIVGNTVTSSATAAIQDAGLGTITGNNIT